MNDVETEIEEGEENKKENGKYSDFMRNFPTEEVRNFIYHVSEAKEAQITCIFSLFTLSSPSAWPQGVCAK